GHCGAKALTVPIQPQLPQRQSRAAERPPVTRALALVTAR
ncbi:MAG: hypothetical protein ACJA1R_000095, partial [Flavobacteriales bacterium]